VDYQLEVDQFLMFNLAEICKEIEDDELKAYAMTVTLAALGAGIPESMLQMYLSPCDINLDEMNIHLSVFLGMELISIQCDCIDDLINCNYNKLLGHNGFALGRSFYENQTMEYLDARDRVLALKTELEF
jgi:hypothetical protein